MRVAAVKVAAVQATKRARGNQSSGLEGRTLLHGCTLASDANYTDWVAPHSPDPCAERPDTAVVALGEVVGIITEYNAPTVSGKWVEAKSDSKEI